MKVCGRYRSLHQHCAALLKRDKVCSQGRKQWWMCLCHIPLFLLCVCLRKKRGRSYTAEVIVCVTTGQNLIVRLLSRWAAGVIGLSSAVPSCTPDDSLDRRGFRGAKHWVSQHSRHGWEAKHMPEEKTRGEEERSVWTKTAWDAPIFFCFGLAFLFRSK